MLFAGPQNATRRERLKRLLADTDRRDEFEVNWKKRHDMMGEMENTPFSMGNVYASMSQGEYRVPHVDWDNKE
jgi:hypothetical protein